MSKSLPPLTWFRSFEAAARTLSFTAAAEEIGMTQSAVSQQVKSLEIRLGVPLFVRHARGLALTDNGRKLLPQVGSALGTLASAAKTFDAGSSTNLLTVATSVSVAQWVIAPSLSEFSALYPELRIRLLSAIWPDDFHTSQADVEIRFGSTKQAGRNAVRLLPDRLIALKAKELSGNLQELPLIEAVGTSSGWQSWGKKFNGEFKPTLYADTYGMALQMAVHGSGVALVSELIAKHAIKSGLLERVDQRSISAEEGYYLSINEELPAAANFQTWLLGKTGA